MVIPRTYWKQSRMTYVWEGRCCGDPAFPQRSCRGGQRKPLRKQEGKFFGYPGYFKFYFVKSLSRNTPKARLVA